MYIWNKIFLRLALVVIFISTVVACTGSGKVAVYYMEMNTTFKPATMIKIITEFLVDETITDKDRITLLKGAAERSLTVMKMYIKAINDDEVSIDSNELIDLVDYLHIIITKYPDIDKELEAKMKELAKEVALTILEKGSANLLK